MLKLNYKPYLMAILSGLATGLAPVCTYNIWILVPFFLFGLFYALDNLNTKIKKTIALLLFSFFFNIIAHFWMGTSLNRLFDTPDFLNWTILSLFFLFAEIQYSILIFVKNIKDLNLKNTIALSFVFVFFEKVFKIVLHDQIGYYLFDYQFINQIYDISSISLASYFVFFLNITLYQAYNKNYKNLYCAISLILAGSMYSYLRTQDINNRIVNKEKITYYQTNFNHTLKLNPAVVSKIVGVELNNNISIFPENFFRSVLDIENHSKENFSQKLPKFSIFGAFTNRSNLFYNSAVLKNNTDFKFADKKVLLPVGEKEFKTMNLINDKYKLQLPLTQGSGENKVQLIKDSFVGIIICFESLDFDHVRDISNKNPNFFVNIGNEMWIAEADKMIKLTNQVRTIENRIPMVRSLNKGYSGVINIFGEYVSEISKNQSGYKNYEIQYPKNQINTLYKQFGDWFFYLSGIISFIYLLKKIFSIYKKQ